MPPEPLALIILAADVTLIAIAGIVIGGWSRVRSRRAEHALKSEMLARGMTADEIVQVIQAQAGKPSKLDLSNASSLACACVAVVERDDEWHDALVLETAEGAYYVHFVGESMSDNQWVDPNRIRFPVDSPLKKPAWPFYSGGNGVPQKGPLEAVDFPTDGGRPVKVYPARSYSTGDLYPSEE
jgi:hypothetical protein